MKQTTWFAEIALLSMMVLVSSTTPGSAAYTSQGQQTFPYPKAFMLHRRAGGIPNLSVVGPLNVLRQKMMLDMMEQKMKNKINVNNEFLSRLGKRGGSAASASPTILNPTSMGVFNILQQGWMGSLDSAVM